MSNELDKAKAASVAYIALLNQSFRDEISEDEFHELKEEITQEVDQDRLLMCVASLAVEWLSNLNKLDPEVDLFRDLCIRNYS